MPGNILVITANGKTHVRDRYNRARRAHRIEIFERAQIQRFHIEVQRTEIIERIERMRAERRVPISMRLSNFPTK
jgi:hypothetical protein